METKWAQLEVEALDEDARANLHSSTSSTSLVGGGRRGGLTPPVAPPLSVEDAKQTLAIFAPGVATHPKMITQGGYATAWTFRYLKADCEVATLMVAARLYPSDVDEKNDGDVAAVIEGKGQCDLRLDLPEEFFSTTGGKFAEAVFDFSEKILDVYGDDGDLDKNLEKTNDVFRRALLAAAISAKENCADDPTAWVLARLKKVLAAIMTLEYSREPSSKAAK